MISHICATFKSWFAEALMTQACAFMFRCCCEFDKRVSEKTKFFGECVGVGVGECEFV